MPADRLVLRPFTDDDESEARKAHEELLRDDFEFLLDWAPEQSWAEWVARQGEMSRGENLAPGRVPADMLAADVDDALVGRASIRHTLDNEFLAEFGGHIGYATRPGFRRLGYATAILRASLARARSLGIEQALLTCDDSNAASAATIERCGGVFERITIFQETPRRRYWVPTH